MGILRWLEGQRNIQMYFFKLFIHILKKKIVFSLLQRFQQQPYLSNLLIGTFVPVKQQLSCMKKCVTMLKKRGGEVKCPYYFFFTFITANLLTIYVTTEHFTMNSS